MVDHCRLNSWIHSRHLDPEVMEAYCRAFTSHPARVLVLKDFLVPEVAERLSQFLSCEAKFKSVYGLYSKVQRDGNISDVSKDAWFEAEEQNRFYRWSDYVGVSDEFRLSSNLFLFRDLLSALRDNDFRSFFEEISGLRFGPTPLINAYSYRAGDFLSSHTDDVKSKRLSFVLYLSADWESRFGGLLHLIDRNGDRIEIEPDYNSLVVFDVTARTEHFVSPVEPCAGEKARLTISGWFLTCNDVEPDEQPDGV
jgi:Rps23 Pro-64 3,4-dihydroxylase Tpa1-like proline 4-hydroxylase